MQGGPGLSEPESRLRVLPVRKGAGAAVLRFLREERLPGQAVKGGAPGTPPPAIYPAMRRTGSMIFCRKAWRDNGLISRLAYSKYLSRGWVTR